MSSGTACFCIGTLHDCAAGYQGVRGMDIRSIVSVGVCDGWCATQAGWGKECACKHGFALANDGVQPRGLAHLSDTHASKCTCPHASTLTGMHARTCPHASTDTCTHTRTCSHASTCAPGHRFRSGQVADGVGRSLDNNPMHPHARLYRF